MTFNALYRLRDCQRLLLRDCHWSRPLRECKPRRCFQPIKILQFYWCYFVIGRGILQPLLELLPTFWLGGRDRRLGGFSPPLPVRIAYRKLSFIAGSVDVAYFVKTAYQCLWRVCCFDSPWFNKNTVYNGVCCFDSPWFNKNTVYNGVCCFDSPWFNKNTVYNGVCCFDSPWFNKNTVYNGVCCFDSPWFNKNTVNKGVCCFDSPWFNKNTVNNEVCCFDSPWFNKKYSL